MPKQCKFNGLWNGFAHRRFHCSSDPKIFFFLFFSFPFFNNFNNFLFFFHFLLHLFSSLYSPCNVCIRPLPYPTLSISIVLGLSSALFIFLALLRFYWNFFQENLSPFPLFSPASLLSVAGVGFWVLGVESWVSGCGLKNPESQSSERFHLEGKYFIFLCCQS